ncbi:hypothetical protein M8C21_005114 [Ambrosia artemisiifolia]|uniref:DUF7054 domain-containing protein n=1 Tax=Ambrosia artemisiifolia TaxID=4212 RepID=A0AAD5GWD9_AMBAR|nr:hypothetical protein M8C21_005114 [Ambrosia artemisiifolia]
MMGQTSKDTMRYNKDVKKNRLLITVNVLGSPGPLRLIVNKDDTVSNVIDSSLKLYARGGRLPILGSDTTNFVLFPSNAPSHALSSNEAIWLSGGRNFVMSKKKITSLQTTEAKSSINNKLDSHSWKSWFRNLNKSFKII